MVVAPQQLEIPAVLMRGGTSKGPFFNAENLPSDPAKRDTLLLRIMGSPDIRQVDGLGGATTTTSKVAIVSKSTHPWADVDYLFAQVDIEYAKVDTAPTCGNMMAAVGPYAIEQNLVTPTDPITTVKIRNTNTNSLIEALVQTPQKKVTYAGDTKIAGVPGTSAPIVLKFSEVIGSKTKKLLPTNNPFDIIERIKVSCVDFAMPMVFLKSTDFNKTGFENPSELHTDQNLMQKLENIRIKAGEMMGLLDTKNSVIPKLALVSSPQKDGNIASRYFTPTKCHPAYAVSGALCISAASTVENTIVNELVKPTKNYPENVVIEHPSGNIEVGLEFQNNDKTKPTSGNITRTARKLFAGTTFANYA